MGGRWSNDKKIEKSLNTNIVQGSLDSASDSFGKNNISAFALALGATDSQVALISGIDSVGIALFEFISSRLIVKISRKKLSLWFVSLKSLMYLSMAVMGILALFGKISIGILFITIALFFIFIGLSYPAYFSWIGSLIPPNIRGKFFAKRKFYFLIIGTITTFLAAITLDFFDAKDGGLGMTVLFGFIILFFLAFLTRGTSGILFKRVYEPKYKKKKESFSNQLKRLKKNGNINFIIFQGLMSFAGAFIGPFIVIYLLKDLSLSYLSYLTIIYAPILFGVIAINYFGKISDKSSNALLLKISYFIGSLVPLGFLFSNFLPSNISKVIFLIFINGISGGIALTLGDLSAKNYLLETSKDGQRASLISYWHIFSSLTLLAGIWIATFILNLEFVFIQTIPLLFSIAFVLKFIFSLFSIRFIK